MIRQGLALVLLALALAAQAAPYDGPIFDAHLHYNDDAVARYPAGTVRELFEKSGVLAILANSRPNDGTRALVAAAKGWRTPAVVPFIRVYRDHADYGTWFNNRDIYAMIVAEERHGYYRGVGEFHVYGRDADTPVLKDIVEFSVTKGFVLHAHCDEEALEILFRHNPKARVIWAHTGFGTPLARVEELLAKYPALWGELSYRSGIADAATLSAEWRALFVKHPGRFLLGSDTWVNARWDKYAAMMASYRIWLGELPRDVAERVAWRNGAELFGLK